MYRRQGRGDRQLKLRHGKGTTGFFPRFRPTVKVGHPKLIALFQNLDAITSEAIKNSLTVEGGLG